MRRARPRTTKRSATGVAVETGTTARASTTPRAITATTEIETSITETSDRDITEKLPRSARDESGKSEDATTNMTIDHAENTRTDEVDLRPATMKSA